MDTIILKTCKENLLRRRHEILPVLKHLEEESADVGGHPSFERPNRGNGSEAYLVERLAACFQRELEGIEIALRRIRAGSFGSCKACHQQIEPARLARFPQAEFCAHCIGT